jgi:hypothetical protein
MIHHLDKSRYKKLRAETHRSGQRWPAIEVHLIDGEHGHCGTCELDVDSLKAATLAELEVETMQLAL